MGFVRAQNSFYVRKAGHRMRQFTFGLIFFLNGSLSLQSLCAGDLETMPRVTYESNGGSSGPACPLGFRGYHGPGLMDSIGNFPCATCGCGSGAEGGSCACHGSYKFPVPSQYTYHWAGIYSQQTMTQYVSPYRYPGLNPIPAAWLTQKVDPSTYSTYKTDWDRDR